MCGLGGWSDLKSVAPHTFFLPQFLCQRKRETEKEMGKGSGERGRERKREGENVNMTLEPLF